MNEKLLSELKEEHFRLLELLDAIDDVLRLHYGPDWSPSDLLSTKSSKVNKGNGSASEDCSSGTKKCKACHEVKPMSQFRPWGRGWKQSCVVCESGGDA